MTARDRYDRIREVFERALEERVPERRERLLNERCAGDPDMRAEVDAMLAAAGEIDASAHPFSEKKIDGMRARLEAALEDGSPTSTSVTSGGGDPATRAGAATLPSGTLVGRFTIERLLGVGGMGAVYAATQERPSRTVALKVIRAGYASVRMLRRFEVEAELLGRLSHPGIAQIFDAGVAQTVHGEQPFFAMEFVEGTPLTEYAEEHRLGTRDRLVLIARVADAVEHAHQKGVIHRDLKPGNILVDASGQPKVLDFGVARTTDADIQTTTMRTDIGALIGTIPYMSPEQASGDPSALDTRSDVYALGVVGYQLLAGRLPYDLRDKMIHEAVRVIREEDPASLSTLDRTLRGDIETIVGKALEKEPTRRYQSAADLAEDLRHYLADEPISARPPSAAYQLRKFSRRNKALVGGVAAVFVVLIGGIAATSWQARVATLARDEAKAAQTEAETNLERAREAEAETGRRAAELEQVAEFQSEQLSGIDTEAMGLGLRNGLRAKLAALGERRGLGEDEAEAVIAEYDAMVAGADFTGLALETLEANIFARAIETIDAQFEDQPLVRARLLHTVARTLRTLGLFEAATDPQERALEIRRRALGDDHPDTLTSINDMGELRRTQGRYAESEPYYREALEARRRVLGDEHPKTLVSIANMGVLLVDQDKLDEAEPFFREAVDTGRRILGDDHPETLAAIANLGDFRRMQGGVDEAELLYREALDGRRRVLGDDHPRTLESIYDMGILLQDRGRLSEAEAYVREALEARRRVLGDEHLRTLKSISSLGVLLLRQGKFEEAEPLYREALEAKRRVLGEDHPNTLNAIAGMGVLLVEQGKLDEAEPFYRAALDANRRVLGNEHTSTLASIANMGVLLYYQRKFDEAELFYREALGACRRVLGEEHPGTLSLLSNLGTLLTIQGKLDEAEQFSRESLEKERRVLGDDHPSTLISMNNTSDLLLKLGRLAEAEQLAAEAVDRGYEVLGATHLDVGGFLHTLARTLLAQERYEDAESRGLEAHRILLDALSEGHDRTSEAVETLVELYDAWHEAEPDQGYDAKAAEWRAKLPPPTEAEGGEGASEGSNGAGG